MGQGDATVATSSDQRDDVTAPEDEVTRVVPEFEEILTAARRGERLNPVELTDSANHEVGPSQHSLQGQVGLSQGAEQVTRRQDRRLNPRRADRSHRTTPARHRRRIQKQRK